MAVVNIIKISRLESTNILAPEFYHPVKINLKKQLKHISTKRIKDRFYNITYLFNNKTGNLTQKSTVFDLSDVTSYFLYGGKSVQSLREVGSTKKIFLQNDVLISRLRPYLQEVTFVGFDGKFNLASTEFIVLRSKDIQYYPETLFAYLISEYMQNILKWSTTGTEHPRFNERYFLNLPLPNFSNEIQSKVKMLVQDAWNYFLDSHKFFSQGEKILFEELKLKDFIPKYKNTYIDKVTEVSSSHRLDAEYYQPAYKEVIKKLQEKGLQYLLDFVNIIKSNFDPSNFPDQHFKYIELSDIDPHLGLINNSTEMLGKELPSRAKRILKENDIIISSVEGSLDKVAIVDKGNDGTIASNGFIQLRPVKINSEVLLLLAKSIVIQSQLQRYSTGTILASVNCNALKNFIIPLLSKGDQDRISNCIKKSHNFRYKALHLLEIVKHSIDMAIEDNESKAIEYLNNGNDKIGDFND